MHTHTHTTYMLTVATKFLGTRNTLESNRHIPLSHRTYIIVKGILFKQNLTETNG